MTKVVINTCFGGFSLSDKAYKKLIEWGVPVVEREDENIPKEAIFDIRDDKFKLLGSYTDNFLSENRDHPLLIKVIEELGEEASGRFASLDIIEIPDDVEWYIEEYDGNEHVAEKHRTWG